MAVQPLVPLFSPAPSPGRSVRVEYLGFQNVDAHREFRFRVYAPDGFRELRSRIANDAFVARRVSPQDGPDVCYQKLLRAIAAGEMPGPGVITIDDGDLVRYREEHTHVARHRSSWTPSSPAAPAVVPPRQPRRPARLPSPRLPVAPFVPEEIQLGLREGQRVNHAVHGMGVTTLATGARTVVRFDRGGLKTFVTSMLELEVLSAPHTWETTPRGTNRPCQTRPAS